MPTFFLAICEVPLAGRWLVSLNKNQTDRDILFSLNDRLSLNWVKECTNTYISITATDLRLSQRPHRSHREESLSPPPPSDEVKRLNV